MKATATSGAISIWSNRVRNARAAYVALALFWALAGAVASAGTFVTAPIVVDTDQVFRIAAPAGGDARFPLPQRVADVQSAIAQLLASSGPLLDRTTTYDPETLRVHVRRDPHVSSLEAVDAKHPDPLPIVTVTSVDATYNATTVDAVAAAWQTALQAALTRALAARQPAEQRDRLREAAISAVALLVLTLLDLIVRRAVVRRARAVGRDVAAKQAAADAQAAPAADAERPGGWVDLAVALVEPTRRLRFYRGIADTLPWLIVVVWFLWVTWAFSLFPVTVGYAATLWQDGLSIATTIAAAILADRLLNVIIANAETSWRTAFLSAAATSSRRLLRLPTIAGALRGFQSVVIVVVAVLIVLTQLRLPVNSVLTLGGLAALALSLAAQSFIRDFVNGFLVLFEDQYAVGDYITINDQSGIVENLTLRMVQIRDFAGDLITIPHSAVTTVRNRSRDFSRVDYRVPIDPQADASRALELIRTSIETLAAEDDWKGVIHVPVEWTGIDDVSRDAVILRALVRTEPLRQFDARRAINARVVRAFGEAGIAFGAPVAGQS